jgi:hypothetical protein
MRDRPVAESSSWQHIILNKRQTAITPVGFEFTIQASGRLQTHALNRAATDIGLFLYLLLICVYTLYQLQMLLLSVDRVDPNIA